MEKQDLFAGVTEICRDVFDNEGLVVTEASTAEDIEGWDSLTHLSLIDGLEKTFGVVFTLDEIIGSSTMGDLVSALARHMEEKRGKEHG